MSLHETTHYNISFAADETGNVEWGTLGSLSDGIGNVHLGHDQQMYYVTYYHHLHCLLYIQRGIITSNRTAEDLTNRDHIHHCLNMLRQAFLCQATDTLEAGDFMKKDFIPGVVGHDMVCQDWEFMIREMQRNHDEHLIWNAQWN